jgi:hypothetical protein
MFCVTFLKSAAVLFLETKQSDQSGFRMNVGNQFPRWKEWQFWATFSARKKCLTRTLLYSLYFIEGLPRKINTFSAEINQSESRPYTHTHTHTRARARTRTHTSHSWDLGMSYYLVIVWYHRHFCMFKIRSKVKCQEHCALKPVPNK